MGWVMVRRPHVLNEWQSQNREEVYTVKTNHKKRVPSGMIASLYLIGLML